jgi:hypothetical protein
MEYNLRPSERLIRSNSYTQVRFFSFPIAWTCFERKERNWNEELCMPICSAFNILWMKATCYLKPSLVDHVLIMACLCFGSPTSLRIVSSLIFVLLMFF